LRGEVSSTCCDTALQVSSSKAVVKQW
jgi:hypothetical protein